MKIPNVEISHTAVDIEYVALSDIRCDTCGKPEQFLVTIKRKYFSLHDLMCEARAATSAAAALALRP